MMFKVILICGLAGYLSNAGVIKGSRGAPKGWCSVSEGVSMGNINDGYITEASGLAYSRRSGQALWVHNDSGGSTFINAVSEHGRRLADVELQGTTCRDWEDIAINVEDGISYIYLADIGDNAYVRSSLTIYKFEEPEVSQDWNGQDIVIGAQDIEHIHIRYPDYHRDCEAMAVDPLNGDILLFTKNHEQYASDVFKVPHGWGDPKTLEYIATLPYIKVTGADISPSGDTLALTNYWEGWSWTKPYPSTPWADFLKTYPTPCNIPVKEEPQREAIAVTDSGYWTTSENQNQPLWYFQKY